MNRNEVLEAATAAVTRTCYGEVEKNFANIAKLASVVLQREFTPADVALFMVCVKLARISCNHGYADSWVDLAGYAACGGELCT